jgi:hypothetical protein
VPPHFLLHLLTSSRPEVLQSVHRPSPVRSCQPCLHLLGC